MKNNLRIISLKVSEPEQKKGDIIYMIMKPNLHKRLNVYLISDEKFKTPIDNDFIIGNVGYYRKEFHYKNLTPDDCVELAEKIKELNTIKIANKEVIINFSGLLKRIFK